jgi:DNA repair protein RadC
MKPQIKQLIADLSGVAEVSVNYRTKVKPSDRECLRSSQDSHKILRMFYEQLGMIEQKEIFSVLLIDKANKVLGFLKVSEGSAVATVVDVQYILRAAILSGASQLIICHNHPSGNMKPSQADLDITTKLKQACTLLEIKLLDHIILSPEENEYYSFADECNL